MTRVLIIKKDIYIMFLLELAMTMAVELRMTANTSVLELRSRLNTSGQLVVGLYKVAIKSIIEF